MRLVRRYSALYKSKRYQIRKLIIVVVPAYSSVFCLMVNRLQFLKDSHQLSISTLSLSRANLCEILAIRVLRESVRAGPATFLARLRKLRSVDHLMLVSTGEWSERSLSLATLLLTPWALFQGASEAVIERAREEGDDDSPAELAGNALEVRPPKNVPAA